ncbi:MAG: BlaI/MecI/CopY family transcriptional regulator [Lachnospiraceae bacterium]
MSEELFEEDKNLSASETLIMKTIWDIGGDVALGELIETLNSEYEKDYARTTVTTFLTKLSAKGFIKTYRKGKLSYIRVLKTEEEYRDKIMEEQMNFWFKGNEKNMMAALCRIRKVPSDVIERIRGILDGLDESKR